MCRSISATLKKYRMSIEHNVNFANLTLGLAISRSYPISLVKKIDNV